VKAIRTTWGTIVPYLDTLLEPRFYRQDHLWQPGKVMGASPDTRRSLAVVPLIRDKRYYGEAPARLRWGYGGVSGR